MVKATVNKASGTLNAVKADGMTDKNADGTYNVIVKITDTESADGEFATLAKVTYTDHGMEKTFEGVGNGPIDAVQRGLEEALGVQIKVLDYNEHALNSGSNAQAASYIHLMDKDSGKVTYGVGVSSNITRSSIRGIFSAVNRLFFS